MSEEEIIAAIGACTTIAELYAFQVEGRSQAVEDAINKRGTELVAADNPTPAPVHEDGLVAAQTPPVAEETGTATPTLEATQEIDPADTVTRSVEFTDRDGITTYSTREP